MGGYTPNGIFYKPDIGASGATEKGKFDDGLNAADALIEANKPENNKLSAFAPTTSAELASVITDKLGSGKLRFDSSVTVISGATTLTPAQAGWIGVTASAPYTLTLPDPTGLKGLFYRVKKVDYNYNLITVAAVSGQFYYTNDEGVVKTTYNRLNTGGAEALFVTDGINWYVFNEELGQVPECSVYLGTVDQLDLSTNKHTKLDMQAKLFDIGSNFNNSIWVSGNATSTSSGHLVDSGGAFTANMVGKRVYNTTDSTYTYITAFNSATDLTVRDDIFTDTEGYEIKYSKFTAPISGQYLISIGAQIRSTSVVADKYYQTSLKENDTTFVFNTGAQSSLADVIQMVGAKIFSLTKDDYIEQTIYHKAGVNTIDIAFDRPATFFVAKLISKD